MELLRIPTRYFLKASEQSLTIGPNPLHDANCGLASQQASDMYLLTSYLKSRTISDQSEALTTVDQRCTTPEKVDVVATTSTIVGDCKPRFAR